MSSARTISDYLVLQRIGGGTFGTCSKVCLRGDRSHVLAWKEIDYGQLSAAELHTLCQEVNLLRALKHPHVVAYHSRIVDADTGRLFVLMEYCQNGDLSTLIGALAGVNRLLTHRFAPEPFVRRVCYQLLDALDYCHTGSQQRQPVIHRDLKPANVLLSADWTAKLADFGLSRVLSSMQSLATSFVGSPMFMSPELLADEGFTTPKSDVWALGCVLHQLMALKAPFSAQSPTLLRLQIRNGCHSQLPVAAFSAGLRRVATEMLHVDLARRPTAAELLARPEVRAWAAAAGKPWSPFEAAAVDDKDDSSGYKDNEDGQQGKTTTAAGRSAWELVQLQNRLADTEARLLAKEADLEEREQRLAEAIADANARAKSSEERLSSWEVRLVRLHESLRKKQRLLAAAAEAKAAATGAADCRTSRHSMASSGDTATAAPSGHSQSQTTVVTGPKRRHTTTTAVTTGTNEQLRHRTTTNRRAAAVLQNFNQLSPIVAVATTTTSPLGKYSPVQQPKKTQPKQQQQQQKQGTYQPLLAPPPQQQQMRRLTPRAIAKMDRGD